MKRLYLFADGPARGDLVQVPQTPAGPKASVGMTDGTVTHRYRYDPEQQQYFYERTIPSD